MQEAIRHGGRAEGRPTRAEIEPAAQALAGRHSVQLIATARRYSLCAEDAEDAYQRGLEILLTKAPSLEEDDLLPWLKTVVKHEAFAIRKQRQRARMAGDPDLAGGLVPGAHEQAERHERLRIGIEAMSRLKPQEVRCLLLRAEGYSYKQICDETGWTYTKVNRCVTEGRKAFFERLAGIESGAECERLAPLLSRLVDGEASAEDVAALRPHLRSCLACRARLRDYRETPARVAAIAPLLATPHLLARALGKLRDLLGFFGAHKTAAIVAAVAAVAGGGAAALHTIQHSPPKPPSHHTAPKPTTHRPQMARVTRTTKKPPPHATHHRKKHQPRPTITTTPKPTTATTVIPRTTAPAPRPTAPTPRPAAAGAEFGP